MNDSHPGMTRRQFLKATAVAGWASAHADCCTGGEREQHRPRPNILYLMTDQHRADCLGYAGNKIIKTPNLDSIAAEGDLEHSMCYDQDHWTALTDGRFKYIYFAYDGREQLFDMTEDPGELHNLVPESSHESSLKGWRERMVQHLSERGEEFVSGGKLAIRKKRCLYSPHYPKDT